MLLETNGFFPDNQYCLNKSIQPTVFHHLFDYLVWYNSSKYAGSQLNIATLMVDVFYSKGL